MSFKEADQIQSTVIDCLSGRRGFDGWWDDIDDDIKADIRAELVEFVMAASTAAKERELR